ncbi:MAG: alginate lyase family protein [Cyclobacteriaceae bacterium]|nr:alginate lyase family protein [Cyclobacteriaceae bacterium]
MHPNAQIEFVKHKLENKESLYQEAYAQLLQYADTALAASHRALEDFDVPGFYIDAERHRTNSKSLQHDSFSAYACAMAYRLSGEEKYAEKAIYYLNAWARINQKYSNYDGSLVMAYSGPGMVIAASLLKDYKGWTAIQQSQFHNWVSNVYKVACDEIRIRKNNWADWGRYGSILSAALLGDASEVRENVRLIKSDLFHKIASDGHMPEETRRGNAGIWYTYFSLAPITAACWVAIQAGEENLFLFEENDTSLKTALDYLLHHSKNPQDWVWHENPHSGSPSTWPGNLFEALQGLYPDTPYGIFAEPARPIVYPTHHFAWTFPTLMPLKFKY